MKTVGQSALCPLCAGKTKEGHYDLGTRASKWALAATLSFNILLLVSLLMSFGIIPKIAGSFVFTLMVASMLWACIQTISAFVREPFTKILILSIFLLFHGLANLMFPLTFFLILALLRLFR
jgi:hypothetical protein